ncbi:hypothetical protein [Haloferax volcanii]|uniref:hypothetical protein n=1 Tax=Haloferax volcanii TaxID=2246 RepID=UPI00385AD6D2
MKYYVDVDDELASRLKEVDDEVITEALEEVVDENAPPADELMHADLSEVERKRREIRRVRRRGTAVGTRLEYDS